MKRCKNCGHSMDKDEERRELCGACSWNLLASVALRAVGWDDKARDNRLQYEAKKRNRQLSEYLNTWDTEEE